MKSFTKILASKQNKRAGEASLRTSSNVPTSGFASADNSTGASFASSEILPYLDSFFDDLNAEEGRSSNPCAPLLIHPDEVCDRRLQISDQSG